MGQISSAIKKEIVDNMKETMTTNPTKFNIINKEEIKDEKNNEKKDESKLNGNT
jgi:hypothetical protein